MNILKILKKDHKEFKLMLSEIKKALEDEDVREAKSVFRSLRRNVLAHSKAEEKVLYESLEIVDDENARELAFRSVQSHEIVAHLLNKLEEFSPYEERWIGSYSVLSELLEDHIKEEETDTFSKAKRLFDGDRLSEMGDDFQTEKEEVLDGMAEKAAVYVEENRVNS